MVEIGKKVIPTRIDSTKNKNSSTEERRMLLKRRHTNIELNVQGTESDGRADRRGRTMQNLF
jgi:hypothetical protein